RSLQQPIHLCLFVRLTRPCPSSTLFPYTTLFRSQVLEVPLDLVAPDVSGEHAVHPDAVHAELGGQGLGGRLQRALGGGVGAVLGDRKSTRLNSSHVKISYAVFCLKKKKTREKWTR